MVSSEQQGVERSIHCHRQNHETAKEVLPKKKKVRRKKASNDPRVGKAREETRAASDKYFQKPSARNGGEL